MNKNNDHLKIALLTMDSALTNHAVSHFIDRHHERIKLVIISDPLRGRLRGGLVQLIRHIKHSGPAFTLFLIYCFVIYPVWSRIKFLFGKLFGRTGGSAPLREYCHRHAISFISSADINNRDIHELLDTQGIDIIITCFFDQILGDTIISKASKTCLNVHPGLLPGCRGVFPEFQVAAGHYPEFGITVHRIEDSTIDSGKILLTRHVDTAGAHSMLAIGRRLLMEGLTALEDILPDIDTHLANVMAQGEGSYYSYPTRADIRKLKQAGYTLW